MSDAIVAEQVVRHFDGRDRAALDQVSFRVAAGTMLEVLGPSGSGKSSLLNILGGLDRADSGRVEIQGRDITRLSEGRLAAVRGRIVGTVFQHHCLPPGLRAIDAVAAPLLWTCGLDPAAAERRAAGLLEGLGLTHHERTRAVQFLSGGQRQRVAFARAIAPDPDILLADEPTAQLDAETAGVLTRQMLDWAAARSATLVIATHAPLWGMPRERQTIRLRKGMIVPEGE